MILRGLTASPPVQGVTVQDPIDIGGPAGFSPVAMGGWWTALPSPSFGYSALGTLTSAANIDWTAAGYFSFTLTAATALTLTFATTATAALAAAAQVNSFALGQMINIRFTGAATASIVWPATISWAGITSVPGASNAAPPQTLTTPTDVTLVCTGTGSAPTFDGTFIAS